MTHKDIYTKYMVEYDKANVTSSYPALTQFEVATLLDKAYLALISQKFTGNNQRKAPFEYDGKAIEDLRGLIVTEQKYQKASGKLADNDVVFGTPDDMLYYVDSTYNKRPTIQINHLISQKFKQSPTNMPWIEKPACMLEGDEIHCFVDPFGYDEPIDISKLDITYIKQPAKFTAEYDPVKWTFVDNNNHIIAAYNDLIPYRTTPNSISSLKAPDQNKSVFIEWRPSVPQRISNTDMSFTAVYKRTAEFTFLDKDGNAFESYTLFVGEQTPNYVLNQSAPAVNGGSFIGWDIEIPEIVPDEDMTFTPFYAYRDPNPPGQTYVKYTFTDRFGALIAEYAQLQAGTDTPDEVLNQLAPYVPDYNFVKWDPDIPETIGDFNITFRPIYSKQEIENTVKWTFTDWNGNTILEETLVVGQRTPDRILELQGSPRPGYRFVRWEPAIPEIVGDSEITFVPVYEENASQETFTITVTTLIVEDNSKYPGRVSSSGEYLSGLKCTLRIYPYYSETYTYTFLGWYQNNRLVSALNPYTFVVTQDETYVAKFSRKLNNEVPDEPQETYHVTIKSNDQSLGWIMLEYDNEVAAGTKMEVVAIAREDCEFIGWSDGIPSDTIAEAGKRESRHFVVDHDIYVIGEFKRIELVDPDEPVDPIEPSKTVSFTYLDWDNTAIAVYDNLIPGELVQPSNIPNDPQREGYTFLRWSPLVPSIVPELNMIFKALYKKDELPDEPIEPTTVKFTYLDWDSSVIATYEFLIPGEPTPDYAKPADPERDGYTFTGWQPEIPSIIPNLDTTFVATYSQNEQPDIPDDDDHDAYVCCSVKGNGATRTLIPYIYFKEPLNSNVTAQINITHANGDTEGGEITFNSGTSTASLNRSIRSNDNWDFDLNITFIDANIRCYVNKTPCSSIDGSVFPPTITPFNSSDLPPYVGDLDGDDIINPVN